MTAQVRWIIEASNEFLFFQYTDGIANGRLSQIKFPSKHANLPQ